MFRVRFERLDEAVAFIAALSRFLASPDVSDENTRLAAHVWADRYDDGSVIVHLSPAALRATRERFGEPLGLEVVADDSIRGSSRLMIGDDPVRALGEADVRQLLQ